jgi:hypothetical protein
MKDFMYKTNYVDITSTCKLIDFTDDFTRKEVWRDDTYTYTCVWCAQSNSFMPTTIFNKKND